MLAVVFGSCIAVTPLLIAAVAIPSAFVFIDALTYAITVPPLVQNIVALVGLGVAIDHALLIVTRWREERGRGLDNRAAVLRASATAGSSVLFSGFTVAVSLAEAWRVLGDPARRSAYDRALARDQQPAARVPAAGARVPVQRPAGRGGAGPLEQTAVPPLRAGPVWVEGPGPGSPAGGQDEEDIRLAMLVELALRYLAAGRGRPW